MNGPVVTSVTELEENKVKLTIDVNEAVIDDAVADAFRELAREVRIPGFRPGKVPRKVLEAKIGTEIARDEALRNALPEQYALAVIESDVDAIASPEIDITSGADGGPVSFDAVVETRPEIQLTDYMGLSVEVPSPAVSDDDVAEQLDRMRGQFAELEVVDRPAVDDDHVTIDIEGTIDGEEVPGLTATDYDYKVGSGAVVAEIDENLRGAKAGDILSFDADHPDHDEEDVLDFRVLVKAVKAEVLPDLDDDFAKEASEYESLDELRDNIVEQFASMRRRQALSACRESVVEKISALVEVDPPQAMVSAEMHGRIEDMAMRLQAQGMSLDEYLEMSGTEPEQFSADLAETAAQAVKVDLALRAIVRNEQVEVTEDDWQAEIDEMATRTGQDADDIAEQVRAGGFEKNMRADIAKRKALDLVIEAAEIADADGNAIDWEDLQREDEEDVDDVADATVTAKSETKTDEVPDEDASTEETV